MIAIDLNHVVIQTKEDLAELLTQINYIPSVFDEQYQKVGRRDNPNVGDALYWDLIDIVIEEFDNYLGLRRKDPNLQERFEKIIPRLKTALEFFEKKNEAFHKTYKAIDETQEREKQENNQ